MAKKRYDGYYAGMICIVIFAFLIYFTFSTFSNPSDTTWLLGIFSGLFGVLGFGSFLKPEIGEMAVRLLRNMNGNQERTNSTTNKQVQQKSSGVQVMGARDVHINVNSDKETINDTEKERSHTQTFHNKETIVVEPENYVYYDCNMEKGQHLKGELSSTSPFDVYFVNPENFKKFRRSISAKFESAGHNEGVIDVCIDYITPSAGLWHLVVRNNKKKSLKVKVILY